MKSILKYLVHTDVEMNVYLQGTTVTNFKENGTLNLKPNFLVTDSVSLPMTLPTNESFKKSFQCDFADPIRLTIFI